MDAYSILDWHCNVNAMWIVEINVVGVESLKTSFTALPYIFRGASYAIVTILIPLYDHTKFGSQLNFFSWKLFQSLTIQNIYNDYKSESLYQCENVNFPSDICYKRCISQQN